MNRLTHRCQHYDWYHSKEYVQKRATFRVETALQGLGNFGWNQDRSLTCKYFLLMKFPQSPKTFLQMWTEQIKGSKKPFGGVPVLTVGDFFQLPPRGKAKALCISEDQIVDIWRDHSQIRTIIESEGGCYLCWNAQQVPCQEEKGTIVWLTVLPVTHMFAFEADCSSVFLSTVLRLCLSALCSSITHAHTEDDRKMIKQEE